MRDQLSVTIRSANTSDAALLAELGARTFADTFADYNRPEDMAVYLATSFSQEQMRMELRDSSCTFLIAEVENSPAGYALMRSGEAPEEVSRERPIEIVRFYLSREWHGQGVANALMRACISKAEQDGCDAIWLGVWERNTRAQAFYRKWNFREVGTHLFQLGSDLQNDLLMARSVLHDTKE